jgi:hypothetical protein
MLVMTTLTYIAVFITLTKLSVNTVDKTDTTNTYEYNTSYEDYNTNNVSTPYNIYSNNIDSLRDISNVLSTDDWSELDIYTKYGSRYIFHEDIYDTEFYFNGINNSLVILMRDNVSTCMAYVIKEELEKFDDSNLRKLDFYVVDASNFDDCIKMISNNEITPELITDIKLKDKDN